MYCVNTLLNFILSLQIFHDIHLHDKVLLDPVVLKNNLLALYVTIEERKF